MEILKLTSVRLSKEDIMKADEIGRSIYIGGRSTVIRAAIWIGLKILTSRNLPAIMRLMFKEYYRKDDLSEGEISLEDVLLTAGVSKE